MHYLAFINQKYVIKPVDWDSHLLETWCERAQVGWPFFISLWPTKCYLQWGFLNNFNLALKITTFFQSYLPPNLTLHQIWNNILKSNIFQYLNQDNNLGLFFVVNNYMFQVNNRNTRTRCKICSKSTIKTPNSVVLVSLLLTLNKFHTLF